jgi:hypothetical protein
MKCRIFSSVLAVMLLRLHAAEAAAAAPAAVP